MASNHFFAMLGRMKYITRWGLMRSIRRESLSEHTLDVAFIAHALAVIKNKRFGGEVNVEKVVLYALYHDATEIITGDLPTPVKYYNKEIKDSYKQLEAKARQRLASLLPDDMRGEFEPYLDHGDAETERIVKAADKLSALIKCNEEEQMNNREFSCAKESVLKAIEDMDMPELRVFMDEFLPSYGLSLDEQK